MFLINVLFQFDFSCWKFLGMPQNHEDMHYNKNIIGIKRMLSLTQS